MKEQIKVTISPKGEVKMEYKGQTGKSCIDATQEIEVALGKVDEKSREKTADYYKPDPERKVFERW